MNAETLKRISNNAAAAGLGLQADPLDSDEILELVAEVVRLQTELAAAFNEIDGLQDRVSELRGERDEARAEIAEMRMALDWTCRTVDRLVGESLTKLNSHGRARLEVARELAAAREAYMNVVEERDMAEAAEVDNAPTS